MNTSRSRTAGVLARGLACCALLAGMVHAGAQPAAAVSRDAAALNVRISQLPASTIDLRTPSPAAAVRPAPPPAAASSVARPPAYPSATIGTARYVPLPAEEARAAHTLLSRQLDFLKPASPGLPPFVAFKGAVVTQTSGSAEVTLIPLALVDSPLRFNTARKLYEGSIAVGLIELGHTGAAKTLSAPIRFQVLGDATAEPSITQLASTSPPFTTIRVSARDVRAGVDLQVLSNVSAEPVRLTLPVRRAQLELRAKTKLQGWGLETAEVSVGASDGEASKGLRVVLAAPLGNLTPQQVVLGDDGSAQAMLRSESIGRVQLTATAASLEPGSLAIDYDFPARFLLAGVGGGLVGGLLRIGTNRTGSFKRLAWKLLLGVLTGALVFGLFALGVNVVGFPLPRGGGEVLVVVVSALGAFFGTGVLAPGPAKRP